jgi:hypothetical protein
MTMRSAVGSVIVLVMAVACGSAQSALAMTMKECSAKYQSAQQAGTLNGMKWNDFRKTECGSTGSQAGAAPSAATPSSATTSANKNAAANKNKPPLPVGNAVFPTAVAQKYSSETPGKARMHTCLDQYHANKSNNTNGGLRWIQKGGGYYSECSKRLKG